MHMYDVIVIGAGHAGCEAALSAARVGAKTLLLTMNLDHLAQMSCNPCIGGVAKGHVVREIDALGGAMGRVAEASMLQFRMLNKSKGPAVWSPRAQCDKVLYQRAMKALCEQTPNLHLLMGQIERFCVEKGRITGVETQLHERVSASAYVLCSGTFLNGKLHYGMTHYEGGRAGDPASHLSQSLLDDLHLQLGRLKTGTPPRILRDTVDFSSMTRVDSDEATDDYFSFFTRERPVIFKAENLLLCYTVKSNAETARIVRENLDKAPLYAGIIEGIGARYCPSFEDKVVRFAHHESHLLHLEPEGAFTGEYYLNGISTSLPYDVQLAMVHSIEGLEHAQISRYAYAIEYDFVFPHQIRRTLQVKAHENLFLAGQINGTSGYEEAAGQGLLAGLNAARYAQKKEPIELGREQSYIGVMIDDLVTKEIVEPYRLFTSRAEYRLALRQDNADLRLCDFAHENGLLCEADYAVFTAYRQTVHELTALAQSRKISGRMLWDILRDYHGELPAPLPDFVAELREEVTHACHFMRALTQCAITAHYDCYLAKEQTHIRQLNSLEKWKIPEAFDYAELKGLKNESRQKLMKIKPSTLAQASRIDGVTPAEVALLQVHLKRFGANAE